jgi:peptide methionine sulfoxide reductase msrA/msrB
MRAMRAIVLLAVVTPLGCSRGDMKNFACAAEHRTSARNGPMSTVQVRVIGQDGNLTPPLECPKLVLSDVEWGKRLTPAQYHITRGRGTEPPFCGGLLQQARPGIYVCVGCSLPLFQSADKFESGTGWPSFFRPMANENLREKIDHSHGMRRTEILCRRCDGHLGHLFHDGPAPTGLRFCVNSESLRFVPEEAVMTLAETILPVPAGSTAPPPELAEAVIAGGCFWCVEAVFKQLDGVHDVVSGYTGGSAQTANYEAVCSGRTGHAEAVRIVYDPQKVSYEQLLRVHFATHDPTTPNRQGDDIGAQYRSTVFFANEEQRQIARALIADLNAEQVFKSPIVTTLEPLKAFYPAEAKHQDYVACNPGNPYVRAVALPKVEKVREKFKETLKSTRQPATPAAGS